MRKLIRLTLFVPTLALAAASPNLVGVGIALDNHGTSFVKIGTIVQGSPADQIRELKPGKVLRAVFTKGEWIDLQGVKLDQAAKLIRGEAHTQVVLRISDTDEGPTKDIAIERRELQLPGNG